MTTFRSLSKHSLPDSSELVHIATLKKPYGIKGWLWVFSHMQNHADIFDIDEWYMKTAAGLRPLTVTEWRRQGSGLVASFREIVDRNQAETMNGTTVWVYKNSLPSLAENEYYWSDLIGLSVINEQAELLGVVKSLFETGAHDVITVAATRESIDDQERLIPWHRTTVLAIDLDAKIMNVAWECDF